VYTVAYAQQLPIKSYTTVDGIAHDRVTRIRRDSRGFLWFCTVDGLSRFDGASFVTFGVEQGLLSPSVTDILETLPGEYWVATDGGGVASLDLRHGSSPAGEGRGSSRFTVYQVGSEPTSNRVRALYRNRAGQIWLGTEGGLFLLEAGKNHVEFRQVDLGIAPAPDTPIQVWALLEDRESNLWLGTSAGLGRRLPNGSFGRYKFDSPSNDQLVRTILEDRDGRIWLNRQSDVIAFKPPPTGSAFSPSHGTGFGSPRKVGPLPIAGGDARQFTAADGLLSEKVRTIFQSTDGRIWVGTAGGLSEFGGEGFRSYRASQGLGATINAMTEDSSGNLWIGTDLGGALRISRNGFISYKADEGLRHPWITSIFEDRAGHLYAISGGELTINQFDGRRFRSVRLNVPEPVVQSGMGRPILAIQDHIGEWWAPTAEGLYRFARAPIERLALAQPKAIYRARDGLANDDVYVALEDSHGDLWITTGRPAHEGLTRWERATGAFHIYSDRDGLPPFNVPSALCEDGAGGLWIGYSNGGLTRYRNGRFTTFTPADGTPASDVWKIYLDQFRRLWVASNDRGLTQVEDPGAEHPRFISYTMAGELSRTVRCLTEDRWGRLYLGTPRGVDRLDPATGRVRHYTKADGLASSELRADFRDRNDALWFGTYEGISRLSAEPDQPAEPAAVLIGGFSIAGVSQPVSGLGQREIVWPKEMLQKLMILGTVLGGTLFSSPIQIMLNLSGGTFDRGVTTNNLDTGGTFTTSAAACSGTGCGNLLSPIANLNNLSLAFTVPSGSTTGAGSVLTGSLLQPQDLSGFVFTGQSAFNQTSTITENVGASGVLGQTVPLTGTLTLNWNGNANSQARTATGTITLSGDLASVPEPSTALLVSFAFVGLVALRSNIRAWLAAAATGWSRDK
jgi:ligand-binding sensor domain-containing protein